jgi:hypothetical protein
MSAEIIKFPEPPRQAAFRREMERLLANMKANRHNIKKEDFDAHCEDFAREAPINREFVNAVRRMLFDSDGGDAA